MKNSEVLVSIMMITYNHSDYIEQAIYSVLEQDGPFRLELVLSNDCSTDATSSIIKNLIKNHPKSHLVRYFDHEKNLGMQENFIFALNECRGDYIAYCEGDDFWTDRKKIFKQLNALSKASSTVLCFHDVDVIHESINDSFIFPAPPTEKLVFKDLLKNHYIPTCSILFRNVFLNHPIPLWLKDCFVLDIPLELYLATKGSFIYLDEKMACYRRNPGGVTQNKEHQEKSMDGYITLYSILARNLGWVNFLRLKIKSFKYLYWKYRNSFSL